MMTTRAKPLPEEGDVVWVDFEPVRGTEQAGSRLALVLSSIAMHKVSRMAIICPVTRNMNPWPAKIFLPEDFAVKGAILADQVRAVDRVERGFRFIAHVPDSVLAETRSKLATLIGIDIIALTKLSGH